MWKKGTEMYAMYPGLGLMRSAVVYLRSCPLYPDCGNKIRRPIKTQAGATLFYHKLMNPHVELILPLPYPFGFIGPLIWGLCATANELKAITCTWVGRTLELATCMGTATLYTHRKKSKRQSDSLCCQICTLFRVRHFKVN